MSGYALYAEAFIDIDEIAAWIAQGSIAAAHRVVHEIYNAISAVAAFPHTGHRRDDLTSRPLSFIRVREYLIAYAPEEKPLWVISVMHGHRGPRVMAAILRSPEKRLPI